MSVYSGITKSEARDLLRGLDRRLGKEAIELTLLAVERGWTLHMKQKDGLALIAPGDPSPKTIHLSVKNRGKAPIKNMFSMVERYGVDPQPVDEPVEEVAKVPAPKPVPVEKPVEKAVEGRHIVSVQPALMRYSATAPGKWLAYPSKTTLERRWSDGTVDYKCAVCTKTSPNHLFFRGGHWAMHVRKGEAKPFSATEMKASLIEIDDPAGPRWTRALPEGDPVSEVGPEAAEEAETEESALETLRVVREAVLRHEHARIAALEEENAALRAELDEAHKKAEMAASTLAALRELIAETVV